MKATVAACLVLLPSLASAQQQLYVSAAGNDTAACTQAAPCREIRKAITLASNGTVINIADGSYMGFDVKQKPGITFKATGSGAVVVKTTDRPDNRDTIFVDTSPDTVLDGLRSSSANRAAVRVHLSPRTQIRRCVFSNNQTWGIFTDFSDDLVIEDNETYGSVTQHGIYVSNSGDRPIIRRNKSHDNGTAGIHVNGDISQGGDGIITGALIEDNVIYNVGTPGGGAGINMDGVQDSIIRNNLIYNNHASGITLFIQDGGAGPKGNQVYHNTVHGAADSRWSFLLHNAAGQNTVRDNVFTSLSTWKSGIVYSTVADENTDSDYNVLDWVGLQENTTTITLAAWQARGKEPHSISATPAQMWVNSTGGDYHPKAGSPLIDKFTVASVTKDIENAPRPRGAASDIGAYESGGPAPSPTPTPQPTPSPASNVKATLTWSDNSTNESGFRIERKAGAGAYAQVAQVGANITTWTESGLQTGTQYCYRVVAYNGGGAAPPSNESCGNVPVPQPTPTPTPVPTPTPNPPPSAASTLQLQLELTTPASKRKP